MAIIEVNSERISFDENSFLNLKEILPKLQKNFPVENYQIKKFTINGEDVDINSEHAALIRPIANRDYIQITFDEKTILLAEIVEDLTGLITKIINEIELGTNYLKQDQNASGEKHLIKIIEAIDVFIQSVTHCCQEIFTNAEAKAGLPIKELQIHLLSIIKAVNSAQSKKDYIMLTDLLEYELKDNLRQWKILILPVLKKHALVSI